MRRCNKTREKTAPPDALGFTLLEVLVATVILAISLTVILQLFSGGLDQVRRATDYTRAVWHAQAKMEEILLNGPQAKTIASGYFEDGYQWRAAVTPAGTADLAEIEVRPILVRVTVSWTLLGQAKQMALETLALAVSAESSYFQ